MRKRSSVWVRETPEESSDIVRADVRVPPVVRSLGLGDTFSFDELIDAVQRDRERPLRIVELAALGERDGVCAVWLMTDGEDLVLHARSDSVLHRQQFVLHELAHMLLDHGHDCEVDDPDVLFPDIPPGTRRRLLRRQDLGTADEIAAEALADQLAAAIRGSAMRESRFVEIFG